MFRGMGCLVLLGAFLVLVSGCASLNANVPFRYQPSLVPYAKTINKAVGVNMFTDNRPEGDIAYTKSVKDISEKVTSKIIDDFNTSKIFKEIHYPAQPSDDLVINGTIDRFIWKLYATPITYIPLLNLVIYFGVPCYEAYGIASITLEVKDNKTGQEIKKIKRDVRIDNSYTLYNFKAGEAGTELEEAFRGAAKQLKEDLLSGGNL